MLLLIIYWIISPIIWILIPVLSIFNYKIRHRWINYKYLVRNSINQIKKNNSIKEIILFHAASSGEFEQLKPILRLVDRSKYYILLSFSSPTIFMPEKHTKLADSVCYHPFDFIWSAFYFLKKLKIKYYIISRNDIWPSHLYIAHFLNINTILVNANLYKKIHFQSWPYRSFFKLLFNKFNLIFTSSNRLKKNLNNLLPNNKIYVSGDSRVDRVLERKNENNYYYLNNYYEKSKKIILGSLVPSDYPVIFESLKSIYPNGSKDLKTKNQCIIIVPHEMNKNEIKKIESRLDNLNFEYIYFSQIDKCDNKRIIIIDQIGILAELYAYTDLAYIGGGFGQGVHSVIEPSIYFNAISFGPNFQILDMAVTLSDNKLASIIRTPKDFIEFYYLINDDKKLSEIKLNIEDYILKQTKASEKIINLIF